MENLTRLRNIYQNYLEEQLTLAPSTHLYEPIHYLLSLPAKRIRAVLVLAGYQCFREDMTAALPRAHAVEVFHNFSLMHDDIMDASEKRRGQETTHLRYSTNQAILSGDAMLVEAYRYLAKDPLPDQFPEIHSLFSSVAFDICVGQQQDMDFELRQDVSLQEYTEMIRLKTAILLGLALQIGALNAGAGSTVAEHLYQYGESLGLAFQMQDDLLDVYGASENTGKSPANDILRNKKTFLVTTFLSVANESDKLAYFNSLHTDFFSPDDKITYVKSLFDQYQIYHRVEQITSQLYAKANKSLENLSLSAAGTQTLLELQTWLAGRNH